MTTPVALSPVPILQFLDNLGHPAVGGSLLTQVGGVNYPTYQDAAGNTPLPNPIPLNSRGEISTATGVSSQLFLASGVTYTFTLYDANGNQLNQATSVNASPLATGNGSGIGVQSSNPNSIATTLLEMISRRVNLFDFLSPAQKADVRARTETLDVSGAYALAFAAITALGSSCGLWQDDGFYRVDNPMMLTTDAVFMDGTGPRSSVIRVHHDLGYALTVQAASGPGSTFVNGFGMRNMSMRAMVPTSNGGLLMLNKVQLGWFNQLQFEDHWGGIDCYGGQHLHFNGVQIFSPRTSGTSAQWTPTNPASKVGSYYFRVDVSTDQAVPSTFWVTDCNFQRDDTTSYIEHGVHIKCIDGFIWSGGHAMGVTGDVFRVEASGAKQITGIKLANVWLDNNCTNNLHILGSTTATWGQIELSNVNMFAPSGCNVFVEDVTNQFAGIVCSGGSSLRAGTYGWLVRGGRTIEVNGHLIGAANLSNASNCGGFCVDSGATNPGGPKNVILGDTVCFTDTVQTYVSANMIGVIVNPSVTTKVICKAFFDINAASVDVNDTSGNEYNDYRGSRTTKAATITAVSGTSLVVDEVNEVFTLAAGLTANNLTGRRNQRRVTMIPLGVSTLNVGSGISSRSGSAIVTAAGVPVELVRCTPLGNWYQVA